MMIVLTVGQLGRGSNELECDIHEIIQSVDLHICCESILLFLCSQYVKWRVPSHIVEREILPSVEGTSVRSTPKTANCIPPTPVSRRLTPTRPASLGAPVSSSRAPRMAVSSQPLSGLSPLLHWLQTASMQGEAPGATVTSLSTAQSNGTSNN